MRKSDIFKKFTVCLIEKNDEDKQEIVNVLRHMGFKKHIHYPTFKAALKNYANFYSVRPPDFIVCEWFDEFDDPKTMESINNSRLKNVPIIILTNNNEPTTPEQAEKIEVSSFLNKPLKYGLLKEAAIEALGTKFNARDFIY